MFNYFTIENTEGFDQETLDQMNYELEDLMEEYGINGIDALEDSWIKNLSDEVFKKYC